MTSAWKTSSFWFSVVGSVTGIAVLGGVMTQEQADQILASIKAIVGGVVIILPIIYHIKSQMQSQALAVQIHALVMGANAGQDPVTATVAAEQTKAICKAIGI